MSEATWQVSDLPEHIATRIRVSADSGCWIYGKGNPKRYGRITQDGRPRQAHRVVYELLIGPIPEALVLDHVAERGCLGYRCVWPLHLEPVTLAENSRRGNANREKTWAAEINATESLADADEGPDLETPLVIPGGEWRAWNLSGLDALAEIFSAV